MKPIFDILKYINKNDTINLTFSPNIINALVQT